VEKKKSFTNNYQQLKLIYEKKKQGISPGIQLKIGSTARPIADPFAGAIVQRPINKKMCRTNGSDIWANKG